MVSLLDIAPASIKIQLPSGGEIEVFGLKSADMASILRRYPEFQQMLTDGPPPLPPGAVARASALAGMGETSEAEQLAATLALVGSDQGALMIELMPAMIAAGCGLCGNEQAERNAAHLPAALQTAMFQAIMRLTMPEGTTQNPFVAEEGERVDVSGKGQDMK